MYSAKIILGMALIAFCCISANNSLKCFYCSGKSSCKKPVLYECNQALANNTSAYLQKYHLGNYLNITSHFYHCFQENLEMTTFSDFYKGCIYSNISGCQYGLKPTYSQVTKKHVCKQCSNIDGCNSAVHIRTDTAVAFLTTIITVILSYVWC